MATYQLGSTLQWRFNVVNAAGQAADMGSAAATITLPDGTTAAGTVSNTPTGTYDVSYPTTLLPGRYVCTLTGSGANSGGAPYGDVADVWPAVPRMLISLDDARGGINLTAANTTGDDELRSHIMTATALVEDIVGPVLADSRTITRSGNGRRAIPLPDFADSITTVVEDAVTLAATAYCLDENGLLWRGRRPGAGTWSDDAPLNVEITYAVGASGIVPQNVITAGKRLVAHLAGQEWAPRPMMGESPGMGRTPSGFAVPNAVLELLAPGTGGKVPGLA